MIWNGSSFARQCINFLRQAYSSVPRNTIQQYHRNNKALPLHSLLGMKFLSTHRPAADGPSISDMWVERLDRDICNPVLEELGVTSAVDMDLCSVQLFHLLFNPTSIPNHKLYAGSLECDGYTVIIKTMDIRRGVLRGKIGTNVDKAFEGQATVAVGQLFTFLLDNKLSGASAFATPAALGRFATRFPDCNLAQLRKPGPPPARKRGPWVCQFERLEQLPATDVDNAPTKLEELSSKTLQSFRDKLGINNVSDLDRVRIIGEDTGEIFPLAFALNDITSDVSSTLLLGANALQHCTVTSQRGKAKLRQRLIINTATLARSLDADSLVATPHEHRLKHLTETALQRSVRSLKIDWRRRRMVESLYDRVYAQVAHLLRAPSTQPTLLLIGDLCGKRPTNDPPKRKTPLFATALLTHVIAKSRADNLPVTFATVNEAYSSQVCPDPSCLRPPQDDWRSFQGQQAEQPPATWIRSR